MYSTAESRGCVVSGVVCVCTVQLRAGAVWCVEWCTTDLRQIEPWSALARNPNSALGEGSFLEPAWPVAKGQAHKPCQWLCCL